MEEITYEHTVAVLNEVVAEFGADYVYVPPKQDGFINKKSCLYKHEDGKPGCIVGQVLARLGLPLPPSRPDNTVGYETRLVSDAWGDVFEKVGHDTYPFTPKANRLLVRVQQAQDEDIPWGRAVSQSIEHVNPIKVHA